MTFISMSSKSNNNNKACLLSQSALSKLLNAARCDPREIFDGILEHVADKIPANHSQVIVTTLLLTRLFMAIQQEQEQSSSLQFVVTDILSAIPPSSSAASAMNATDISIAGAVDLALNHVLAASNDEETVMGIMLVSKILPNSNNVDQNQITEQLKSTLHAIRSECIKYDAAWQEFTRYYPAVSVSSGYMEPTIPGVPDDTTPTATASSTTTVDRRALELTWKLTVSQNLQNNNYNNIPVVVGCMAALTTAGAGVGDSSNKRAKTADDGTTTSVDADTNTALENICHRLAQVQHPQPQQHRNETELKEAILKLVVNLENKLAELDKDSKLLEQYKDESSSSKKRATSLESSNKKLVYYLPTVIDELYKSSMLLSSTSVQYIDAIKLVDGSCCCDYLVGHNNYILEQKAASIVSEEFMQAAAADIDKTSTSTTTEPRAITPPIITEAMELNEWAVSVSFLELVKPSQKLVDLLALADGGGGAELWHDVIVPIVNKTLLKLSQETLTEKATRKAPVALLSPDDATTTTMTGGGGGGESVVGQVQVYGELTPDKQLCKAVAAFYYHALEAILYCENARISSGTNSKEAYSKLVQNPVFHNALLSCCCSCVTKAIGCTQKLHPSAYLRNLQIYSILHVTGTTPYEFLKVSETFVRALTTDTARGKLGSPLIFALPRILQVDIKQVEVNIIDSLLWARTAATSGSSSSSGNQNLTDIIIDFQEKTAKERDHAGGVSLWPPEPLALTLRAEILDAVGPDGSIVEPVYPDTTHENYNEFKCVSYVFRKLLRLAYHRIYAICKELKVPEEYPVAAQVWVTFRYLMRNRIELLYDRHVDHWILCSIYGVSRTVRYQPELKFAQIIEAYIAVRGTELGSVTCQRIVRHIKIVSGKDVTDSMGNVITLYNKVFVPSMKEHLLNAISLKNCTEELARLQSGGAAALEQAKAGTIQMHVQTAHAVSEQAAQGVFGGGGAAASLHFGEADGQAVEQVNEFASAGMET